MHAALIIRSVAPFNRRVYHALLRSVSDLPVIWRESQGRCEAPARAGRWRPCGARWPRTGAAWTRRCCRTRSPGCARPPTTGWTAWSRCCRRQAALQAFPSARGLVDWELRNTQAARPPLSFHEMAGKRCLRNVGRAPCGTCASTTCARKLGRKGCSVAAHAPRHPQRAGV